jgi:hypothetical protein
MPVPTQRARQTDLFLRGPIPWKDIETVAVLGDHALAVWLLIQLRTTLSGDRWVSLPITMLARIGVDRAAKMRALRALRRAGLIITRIENGKTTLAALVPRKGGRA